MHIFSVMKKAQQVFNRLDALITQSFYRENNVLNKREGDQINLSSRKT